MGLVHGWLIRVRRGIGGVRWISIEQPRGVLVVHGVGMEMRWNGGVLLRIGLLRIRGRRQWPFTFPLPELRWVLGHLHKLTDVFTTVDTRIHTIHVFISRRGVSFSSC